VGPISKDLGNPFTSCQIFIEGARYPAQGDYDIVGLSCDWFGVWKMKSLETTFLKNRVSDFSHKNYKPLVAHGDL
jgi:hypothetical protein